MTIEPSDNIEAAALDWAVRTGDPGFSDWSGFESWLARDPAHAARYDAIMLAIGDATASLAAAPAPRPAVTVQTPPRRRAWWAAGIAAALAGVLGWTALPTGAEPWSVETGPGAAKRIAFADGTEILLAGGSRVTLDRAAPRTARLDAGEALFVVRHDEAQPYRVTAGDYELVDLGTVFSVKRGPDVLRVAVSEGEVMLDPAGSRLRVPMGKAVAVDTESRRAELSSIDPETVGGWRSGQLSYDGARLEEVALDIARLTGRPVMVAPAVRDDVFRGTIDLATIGGDPAALAVLLGVKVRDTGQGWELAQ